MIIAEMIPTLTELPRDRDEQHIWLNEVKCVLKKYGVNFRDNRADIVGAYKGLLNALARKNKR